MPFTYVLKSILQSQNTTNCGEIFNVLVKECNLMVGSCSRPDCIQNNRDACRSPKTEELSTCFNAWVVKNTSRDKIKFSLLGKNGELKGESDLHGNEEKNLSIVLTDGPIRNIFGGKIDVTLKGQGKELNKEQDLIISNLRVIVDGYYDKEF